MTGTRLTSLELRRGLVQQLRRAGYLRSAAVEQAFLTVPRHAFTPPGTQPEQAYRDEVIPLVPGLATLSQPSIVALMLEELGVKEGMSVLEVGTASGFNAALLAELTGNPSLVYTVEIDPFLACLARQNLDAAGFQAVHVRSGDGSLGWSEAAPFNRIMLTAEAADLSHHLLDQLEREGVLLAPFAGPGLPGLLLRLEREAERIAGRFVGVPVSFVPLRGEYGEGARAAGAGRSRLATALESAERRAWEEPSGLSLDQRLTLALAVAARSEQTGGPASEVAAAAWDWFAGHGRPGLPALEVSLLPPESLTQDLLGFRRRDYAFCLEVAGEGNPAGGRESPRREGMS